MKGIARKDDPGIEQSLRDSEIRYRRLFEAAQDGILILDAKTGMIEDVNPFLIKMLGYSREEFIKKKLWEVGAFRDIEASKEAFETLQEKEYIRYEDLPLKTKDGRLIQVEFVSNVYRVGDEKVIQCNIRDITAHKRAERSTHLQSAALNAAANAIVITNREGIIEWVNLAFTTLTGYSANEALGKNPRDLVKSGQQDPAFYKQLWETILAGKVWQGQLINRRKDGSLYSEEQTITPLQNADGSISRFIAIKLDISERKQAEERLRLSEEKYRTLVEEINDGFYVTDSAGVFTFANSALARMHGMEDPRAMIGRRFSEFIMPQTIGELDKAYRDAMQGGHTLEIVNGQIERPDGTRAFIEVKPGMMIAKDGQITGSQGVVRDVTARKQAEVDLRNAEARYRVLFEQSPYGVLLIDIETGKVVETNEIAHKQLGYTREEFAALRISDYEASEGAEETAMHMQKIIREGSDDFETLHRTKNGEIRNVHVFVKTLPLSDVKLFYAIYQDITEIKQAQNVVRSSEERFRALIENASDMIMTITAEGKLRYVSPAVQRISGYQVDEVLGRNIIEFIHKDDLPLALESLASRRQISGLAPAPIELRFRHKDGTWRIVEILGNNLIDHPAVTAIVLNVRDITERKQADAILLESEKRYRTLFDRMSDGIYRSTHAGSFVDVNPAMVKMFGYSSKEEMLAVDIKKELYFSSEERGSHILDTGQEEIETYRMRRKDGSEIWVEDHGYYIHDEQGQPIFHEGMLRNVTERKRAEKVLYESEERFKNAFQYSAIGMALVSLEGKCLKVNSMLCSILGYSEDELLMKTFQDITHPDDLDGDLSRLNQLLAGEIKSYTMEKRYLHKEGRIVWAFLAVALARDNMGMPLYFISQINDITERKRSDEKIQRQLGQLSALGEIDRAISSSFDLRLSLGTLLAQVTALMGVDAADVLLFDPVSQMLKFSAGRGFRTLAFERGRPLRSGEGYAGRVVLDRTDIHITDLALRHDNPRLALALTGEGFTDYLGVPLIAKGKVKGVLEIFHRSALEPDQDWLNFLHTLAGQASIAIDNLTLFDDLQRSNSELMLAYETTLEGWSRALDLRDKETEGHTQRVTDMSVKLARAFGLSEAELVNVRRGGLLHDIGKMGVPDNILLKPNELTPEEWQKMRMHPVYAYDLLSNIAYLHQALDIPYCHHEKWDGSGYPRGLKGDQIPLVARIFAVVDVWDALISERPYRAAWTKEKAREHIRASSGTHFDPRVVDVFMKMIG